MLGALSFGGRLMTFVGILIYKRYFLRSSWRSVYIFSTCLLAVLSVLQLLLIFHINEYLGISNFLFSLGDDVMTAFISGGYFWLLSHFGRSLVSTLSLRSGLDLLVHHD